MHPSVTDGCECLFDLELPSFPRGVRSIRLSILHFPYALRDEGEQSMIPLAFGPPHFPQFSSLSLLTATTSPPFQAKLLAPTPERTWFSKGLKQTR